jgi:hypothetical protein
LVNSLYERENTSFYRLCVSNCVFISPKLTYFLFVSGNLFNRGLRGVGSVVFDNAAASIFSKHCHGRPPATKMVLAGLRAKPECLKCAISAQFFLRLRFNCHAA